MTLEAGVVIKQKEFAIVPAELKVVVLQGLDQVIVAETI